jgi:hypothetical protein
MFRINATEGLTQLLNKEKKISPEYVFATAKHVYDGLRSPVFERFVPGPEGTPKLHDATFALSSLKWVTSDNTLDVVYGYLDPTAPTYQADRVRFGGMQKLEPLPRNHSLQTNKVFIPVFDPDAARSNVTVALSAGEIIAPAIHTLVKAYVDKRQCVFDHTCNTNAGNSGSPVIVYSGTGLTQKAYVCGVHVARGDWATNNTVKFNRAELLPTPDMVLNGTSSTLSPVLGEGK